MMARSSPVRYVFPVQLGNVRLKVGALTWSRLPRNLKQRLILATQRAGTRTREGGIYMGPSDSILAKRDQLKEKAIQAKVKVRELEILLNQ
jgi:hypothetical protein